MIQKIVGEQPFQILSTNFSISPTQNGEDYTLQISADGVNFSDLFTVSAGQTKMVTNVANGSYYRLKNNTSEVEVNWRTSCKSEGGGGGGVGPQGPQGPQGPAGAGDSGQVQTQIDQSISAFSDSLQEGQPIVGMAAQLYSPDGVTSEGAFNYRTTAGDADVATGDAELRKLEGNSDYSNITNSYSADATLYIDSEPVEGFTYNITSGDVLTQQWVNVGREEDLSSLHLRKVAMDRFSAGSTFGYYHFVTVGGNDVSMMAPGTTGTSVQYNATAITANSAWTIQDGILEMEDGYLVATLTAGTDTWAYIKTDFFTLSEGGYKAFEYESSPNDIPSGETTYTFGISSWSPELPKAISDLEINGQPYVPSTDDVIVINKLPIPFGEAKYPQPDSFVALGLNSFDYTCEGILTTSESDCKIYYDSTDNNGKWGGGTGETGYTTYFVKAVTGLENGYVVHSPNGYLEFGVGLANADNYDDADFNYTSMVEVSANTTYVVYPTTAMPYVVFAVADGAETDICVHPRWSGKQDEGFEEYSESIIDLSNLAQYPLYSIGDYRNEIDLKNGVFKEYVTAEAFDADTLNDYLENGYTLGVDIAYDENYIYLASDTPNEISISADYTYKDNDFSVEYFVEDGSIMAVPVYATNYYVTNLVDKLRRMQADFIHLDDTSEDGEVGKTYEYQGRLMKWVAGSGYTAEWLRSVGELGGGEGDGLIYSTIPDGQILFEIYYSSYTHRNVVYRNQTLYLMEGDNVITSAATGSVFKFECNGSTTRYIQGKFENGHIGFYKYGTFTFANMWDGKANGGHYELIDKYNYPYLTPNQGIPVWNDKGQVVGTNYGSISTKNIYVNVTGTSSNNRLTVVTNSYGNGPDRWFAPVTGGNQGQTLVSGGENTAPVWETRIKVVKITSAAYEALVQAGTTDPNTLYAIDDNV